MVAVTRTLKKRFFVGDIPERVSTCAGECHYLHSIHTPGGHIPPSTNSDPFLDFGRKVGQHYRYEAWRHAHSEMDTETHITRS